MNSGTFHCEVLPPPYEGVKVYPKDHARAWSWRIGTKHYIHFRKQLKPAIPVARVRNRLYRIDHSDRHQTAYPGKAVWERSLFASINKALEQGIRVMSKGDLEDRYESFCSGRTWDGQILNAEPVGPALAGSGEGLVEVEPDADCDKCHGTGIWYPTPEAEECPCTVREINAQDGGSGTDPGDPLVVPEGITS